MDRGIYFIRSEEEEEYLSYGELFQLAWKEREQMSMKGLYPGIEVILQYEDNRSFLIAFWACILGKMIPVPQGVQRGKESIEHILKIYQQLKNPFISTTNSRRKEITQYAKEQNIYELNFYEEGGQTDSYKFTEHTIECEENELAFLQFSSGSTGEPKGVMVSHYNLMENFKGMIRSSQIRDTDSMLSWMPLYHNLGLIVSHMLGIVCNLDSYLMSTELFIYQPYLWMEKISQHKITLTCSPNFGYRYYLRGIMNRDCSDLDLSHLRIILNGAEPISLKACKTFLEMMKPYGLQENVFQTGYGLAEATVSVTSTEVGKSLQNIWISGENQEIGNPVQFMNPEPASTYTVELVKVGRPHFNIQIRVVDNKGMELGEGYFGEIQVKGPIVCSGYYEGLYSEQEAVIQDGWLNTGDIGFLYEGQLIISGRKKDIIFVNGKNYYCQDLEAIIYEEYPNCECAICGVYQKEAERDQIILFLVKGDKSFIELRRFGEYIQKRVTKRTGLVIDKAVLVNEIPKTASGKKQRYQLRQYIEKGLYYDLYRQYTRAQVIDIIQEQLKKVLGFTMDDFDDSIVEAGLNSIKAANFHKLMMQIFDEELPVSIVYDYPSVNAIADYILGIENQEEKKESGDEKRTDIPGRRKEIAVIGMACQFPGGADSVEKYWTKLLEEFDGITEVPEERKELKEYCDISKVHLQGGFLAGLDQFDAGLFGITPKEADYLDPQQRLLLKHSYLALMDGCLNLKALRGTKTGVFVGMSNTDYREIMRKEELGPYILSGTMNSMAAGRISYTFDFQGPSVVVDTACSSSLVAIHMAAQSLQTGESEMALACGVNCILSPYGYIGLSQMNALSPTYRCHTFDERADGYVRSEGCGVVVLKRYEDAVKDGDKIYAVIKGSAVNSDGWSSGLTAPNGTAQVKVMKQALRQAGIQPSDVSFIETHGTGTKLGDPQEINALNVVYGGRKDTLLLGSCKTNIGHAESAAGIASFIKTALALSKGIIPGSRDFQTKNHLIPWDSMKFEVVTQAKEWNEENRIAGVSAFGLSGTNVHIIVGQTKEVQKEIIPEQMPLLITISARKKELLEQDMRNLLEYLESSKEPLTSILYTVNRCRTSGKFRIGIAAQTREEYKKQLHRRLEERDIAVRKGQSDKKRIGLLCGGIEKTDSSSFTELYEKNWVFQHAADECVELLDKDYNLNLFSYMNGVRKNSRDDLFLNMVMEYGIWKTLEYFKICPDVIISHGTGEWIGALAAGVLTLRQAFLFADCMEQIKKKYGKRRKTALLFMEEERWNEIALEAEENHMHLITVNTRESIVISYEEERAIHELIKRYQISYMEFPEHESVWIENKHGAAKEFRRMIKQEIVQEGEIPYISSTAGIMEHLTSTEESIFERQLEQTARIQNMIKEAERMECDIYLECNIKPYLSALTAQNLQKEKAIIPIIRKRGKEDLQIRKTIGELFEMGVDVQFSMNMKQGSWLADLPNKEWKQNRYWFERK